jgi:hypothetical protein
MGVDALKAQGRRAGNSEGVEWLGRAGLGAQGAIYALVGLLALQVAIDGRDAAARPDKEGALQLVVDQPFGKLLLALLGLGFAAYALWRFAQSLVDRDGKGTDVQGLGKRVGYFGIGSWYVALTVLTVSTLLEPEGGSGGGTSEQQATAGVFDLPLGRELVAAAALGFVVAAGWNVYRAFSGNLDKKLGAGPSSDRGRQAALALGGAGHTARGIVFALVGVFLGKAAAEFDPNEAKGLDGALLELAAQPYGPHMLAGVAVGLVAFALWCWAQARYRDV